VIDHNSHKFVKKIFTVNHSIVEFATVIPMQNVL